MFEEMGDLLFVMANLARHLEIDPEAGAARRERQVHPPLPRGRGGAGERAASGPEDSDLTEMDALWDAAKAAEKDGRRRGCADPGRRAGGAAGSRAFGDP